MPRPEICTSLSAWQSLCSGWQAASVGFVPTMGNIHAGHVQLVKLARAAHDKVVVSIFVNPLQFDEVSDFQHYPRTLDHDLGLLDGLADVVFCPSVSEMYPVTDSTIVEVISHSDTLLGAVRAGHFRGVTTVVCKLLHIINAEAAYFGQKDYQQLFLIKRMAADLFLPTRIVGVPTVRDTDGLALSSRNSRLGPTQRRAATVLYRALQVAQSKSPQPSAGKIQRLAWGILKSEPLVTAATVDVCDPATLLSYPPDQSLERRAVVLLLSARFGDTLLIDQAEWFA